MTAPTRCVECGERLNEQARTSGICTPCWWKTGGVDHKAIDRLKKQRKRISKKWT